MVVVLLLGGAAWYARTRLTEVREPWSSVPSPGEPATPGDPTPPSVSPVSAAWAEPDPEIDAAPKPRPSGAEGAAPGPEYTIKGNADSMLFHPPSG
jgi:hypothetical protein